MNPLECLENVQRHFADIGASLILGPFARRNRQNDYALDVRTDARGRERFVVSWDGHCHLELQVLHKEKGRRHLLLLVKKESSDGEEKHRYLCGHDERHWFAATVPNGARGAVSTVAKAMEALKPPEVQLSQQRARLRTKVWQRRHNPGFLRQGEWFFVPAPEFEIDPRLVLHDEPLTRGGKPHRAEWLVRTGGRTVYVSRQHPQGLSQARYQEIRRTQPEARFWDWRVMRADPTVHCRGTIRHPDHATLVLPFWHQVHPNTEAKAPWREKLVFLD